jgi:hypothetical protein
MDIDPIKRNIMMKKVAGFHSLDQTFFFKVARGELWRSGFGIKLSQNDV